MKPAMAAPVPVARLRLQSARRSLVWLAALLPFLLLALVRFRDGPGLSADDYGQYLMHARALAEGRAYTDIGYIYSPFRWGIGPAVAPPGLPLVLAGVYVLVGPNITVMRMAMLVFAAALVMVSGLYFARHDDRRLGIGVALLCALAPDVSHSATQLLTDLPAAALIWLVIYLVDMPGRFTVPRMVAIALLGAFAVAFRLTSVALLPALLLFAALQYRAHGLRPAVPAMIWLLAAAVVLLAIPLENLSVLRLQRILEWKWTDTLADLRTYWPAAFESHTHPFPWPRANDVFHVITGVLTAIGIGSWIRGAATRFGTIFAAIYLAMLLVLPIGEERYLWVLFPFLVFGLLNGARVIVARLSGCSRRASVAALVLAMILVPPALARGFSEPGRVSLYAVPEVQQLVNRLKQFNSSTPTRVVFYKPRSFAWVTGIPAMGQIGGPPHCLISELARARITHVVAGSMREGLRAIQQRDLARLQHERPDIFVELWRTEHFIVYQVRLSSVEAEAAHAACHGR